MTRSEAIAALLAQAEQDKDTQESPRGSNRGPRVEAMLRNTGLGGGYPWCAAAVATWGIEAMGSAWPVPHTADCDALLGWAQKQGVLRRTDAEPGDIFLVLKSANDAIHTGVVVQALANGRVLTWEGNTNDGGSREGYRVCQRRRNAEGLVYVRWADVFNPTDTDSDIPRLPETPAYSVWVSSSNGLFPRIQMRGGRPCAPVRQLVAAILGISLEATGETVTWSATDQLPLVRGKMLVGAYTISDQFGRACAWAPVREIGEALGCVVSAGSMSGVPTVSIGPPTTRERTEL